MTPSRTALILLLLNVSCSAFKYRPSAKVRSAVYSSGFENVRQSSDCFALDDAMIAPAYSNDLEADSSRLDQDDDDMVKVEMVGRKTGIVMNLMRGSFLRIASDLSGGTPLEVVKSKVTISGEDCVSTIKTIYSEGGIKGFWRGTPSRTVEGFFMGAIFLAGSAATKRQVLRVRPNSRNLAALAGGVVGGVAQAFIMTPAGLIFTAVNSSEEDVSSLKVMTDIIKQRGPLGLFAGFDAMSLRQATNWASRSTFTEIARSTLGMSKYGLIGEIGSGVIGGLGSTWNTPIETLRVLKQKDIAQGIEREYSEYKEDLIAKGGNKELFRGITPRGVQAVSFMFRVYAYTYPVLTVLKYFLRYGKLSLWLLFLIFWEYNMKFHPNFGAMLFLPQMYSRS